MTIKDLRLEDRVFRPGVEAKEEDEQAVQEIDGLVVNIREEGGWTLITTTGGSFAAMQSSNPLRGFQVWRKGEFIHGNSLR